MDKKALRHTLGGFATGVCVITAPDPDHVGGHVIGMTANSFSSVSLTPPLVQWCLDLKAHRYDVYAKAPRFGAIANVIAAMLVVGYMLGFGFFLMEAVGPGMPMIAALPLVISALLLMPLAGSVERRSARIAAVVLLAVAIAIALWVRLDALAPSVAVYSTSNGVH